MAVQITVEGQAPKYLTAPTYTLGRAVECDVRLPENDRLVSREHARLEREGEKWWIVDQSTNGTFVNGERMAGRRALYDGDQIGIGRSQIAFAARAEPPARAIPNESPARSAQTVFVTASELRASAREASSRSQAPLATPLATPRATASTRVLPPPESQKAEAPPGAAPVASSPAPAPIVARAPRESGGAAPVRAEAAPTAAPAAKNGLNWANGARAALEPSEAEAGSVDGGERMKQCSSCGHGYALEQNDCPSCGDSGFQINGGARATVLVTERMMERVTVPTTASIPAPTSAPAPAADATPFDLLAKQGAPVPTAPNGVANGVASGVAPGVASGEALGLAAAPSIPVVPQGRADAPRKLPEGVTFGLPAEPRAAPSLRLAGVACGLTMLLSLFLPWALSQSGGISYVRFCGAALEAAARGDRGGLVLLLPALATLVALSAALGALASRRSTGRGSSLAMALGGALGLLGTGMLQANPWGLSEPGIWLFGAASLGAVVIGLSRLARR